MGPVWKGLSTEPVFAIPPSPPAQIHQLGHEVALETYYDVASSAQVSAGGYGGPGHSGGTGDALVRLVNEGNFEVDTNGDPGALCANIYVFDDDQQLEECCSCEITADGVLTLSTINDLTSNPAFNNARMSVGVIKVVTTSSSGRGTHLPCVSSPLGVTAQAVTPDKLAEGLEGWTNHAETIASNLPPSFAFVTSTSVDEFANAPLDSGELSQLTSNCAHLVDQASGAGICAFPLCGFAPID
jgi:hypothetical protein